MPSARCFRKFIETEPADLDSHIYNVNVVQNLVGEYISKTHLPKNKYLYLIISKDFEWKFKCDRIFEMKTTSYLHISGSVTELQLSKYRS